MKIENDNLCKTRLAVHRQIFHLPGGPNLTKLKLIILIINKAYKKFNNLNKPGGPFEEYQRKKNKLKKVAVKSFNKIYLVALKIKAEEKILEHFATHSYKLLN